MRGRHGCSPGPLRVRGANSLLTHLQLAIQVSKDGLPGRVPLWVILLSAFAGLLLLLLLILALWKVSAGPSPPPASAAGANEPHAAETLK